MSCSNLPSCGIYIPYLNVLLLAANYLCGCTQHVVVEVEFPLVTQVLHCKMEGKCLTLIWLLKLQVESLWNQQQHVI